MWLRFAEHVGEKSAGDRDTGLNPAGDDDVRTLAGHAKAAAPHPQTARSVIDLERALVGDAKRVGDLPRDGDVFRHVLRGIVIDRGNLGCRTAGCEDQKSQRQQIYWRPETADFVVEHIVTVRCYY